MNIYVSLLVMVVGALMYLLAKPDQPKALELGRIMFAFGLLVSLLQLPPHIVTLFPAR